MTASTHYLDRVAELETAERIATRQRSGIPGRHRPRGRHALAHRLRSFADRLAA